MRVSITSFGWPRALCSVLRHVSLPWLEDVAATPLGAARELGHRDRLSLVAQYAAHQAFLQFAGVADAAFDAGDWAVVRKRGRDCRLVRVAAAPPDVMIAPPVLSLVQEFAEAAGATGITTLARSWARADTVYGEIMSRLSADISADLRWMRAAAAGEIVSPGADALREIWSSPAAVYRYSDAGIAESLRLMAEADPSACLMSIGTTFPLQRYSALATIVPSLTGNGVSEAEAAERLTDALARHRSIVMVGAEHALDPASRRVIDIAAHLGGATWVLPDQRDALPASRFYVVSPRLAALTPMGARITAEREPRTWLEQFTASPALDRYLAAGDVPVIASGFEGSPEPKRSYVAVLALLGRTVPQEIASRFLRGLAFEQSLEDMAIEGVCAVREAMFEFDSEAMREHCVAHIPPASRSALCRAAAVVSKTPQSGLLLFEAGERERAIELLESVSWTHAEDVIVALTRLPAGALSPRLAATLADALTDCGRYDDAVRIAPLAADAADRILARCDRRRGNYRAALARVSRIPDRDESAQRLFCELLRLLGRHAEALQAAGKLRDGEYEKALIRLELGEDPPAPRDSYAASRIETYRALRRGDFVRAAEQASEAVSRARSVVERIDAWMDRVFTSFSSGRWNETRALALEALTVIDETQNDRAAAAIVYVLAYLAADDAHWTTAAHLMQRLRRHHANASEPDRLLELDLLDAHYDFSRGRFGDARTKATRVYERQSLVPQIREAAALILDEIDWIEHKPSPSRSSGQAGNVEMQRRHERMRRRGSEVREGLPATRAGRLELFRTACREAHMEIADAIAAELDLTPQSRVESSATSEFEMITAAATADYPFGPDTFGGLPWCFATRNRLGRWSVAGTKIETDLDAIAASGAPDWIRIADGELLHMRGIDEWLASSRHTLSAVFRLRAETTRLRRLIAIDDTAPRQPETVHEIVGESVAIRAVFQLIDRVARRDVAVLIVGESGTGKELVARAIQRASSRRGKPFTTINCAALPETLIEAELFGHVRGAFTGADRDRAGLIESADGGTLFLDEAGELPLAAQAKLLRFLQDGEFRRVGDTTLRMSDVRVLSATNRQLEAAVEEGSFREDLYYRLRGVDIPLPPLRERGEDVLLLANHFLAAERTRHRTGPVALSSETEMLFRAYRWPGNVRELQNTIRAAHAMAGDDREVAPEHLPERMRATLPARQAAGSYQDALTRFRRDLIEKSLMEAGGNQNRAAARLNISRQALAYQIRELGILVGKRPRV